MEIWEQISNNDQTLDSTRSEAKLLIELIDNLKKFIR